MSACKGSAPRRPHFLFVDLLSLPPHFPTRAPRGLFGIILHNVINILLAWSSSVHYEPLQGHSLLY